MTLQRSLIGFAVSGVIATLTHVITAIALIEELGIGQTYANGMAFSLATLISYVGNTVWGFDSKIGKATAWRFLLVSIAAGLLTMLIAWLVERSHGHYLFGIASVVLIVPPATFLAHQFFTYRHIGTTLNLSDLKAPGWHPLWIAIAVAVVHGQNLSGSWRFDDPLILQFAQSLPNSYSAFVNPSVWQGLGVPFFTPMLTFAFQLGNGLFGMFAWGYYLLNLCVIWGIASLTCFIVRGHSHSLMAGLVSALLFVAGAPTLVVAGQLMSQHYALGLLFALCSLLLWQRWILDGKCWAALGSAAFYILAMLCKEVYAPLPLVLCAFMAPQFRNRILGLTGHVLVAVGFVAWRAAMIGTNVGGYTGNLGQLSGLLNSAFLMPTIFWGADWPGRIGATVALVFFLALIWRSSLRTGLIVGAAVIVLWLPFVAVNASPHIIHFRFGFLPWWAFSVLVGVTLKSITTACTSDRQSDFRLVWVVYVFVGVISALSVRSTVLAKSSFERIALSYDVQSRFLLAHNRPSWYVPADNVKSDLGFQYGLSIMAKRIGMLPALAMPFAQAGAFWLSHNKGYAYEASCQCMKTLEPLKAEAPNASAGLVKSVFDRTSLGTLTWQLQTTAPQPEWYLLMPQLQSSFALPPAGEVRYAVPPWLQGQPFSVVMRAGNGTWTQTPEQSFPKSGETVRYP
ncbi:MAG: GtrA family protein [Burkholderiales bacterium]|nr:GtrA family protein [Burkholderiales bacterium]